MNDRAPFNAERCSVAVLNEALGGIRESGKWSLEQCIELERVVRNRARELGGYIRQMVRLVRLGALCSRTSYLEFFYKGAGSVDDFHRLAARALLPPGLVVVEKDRVRFLEERLASPDGRPFELSFRQMPRLAALLDIMHYTLGYEVLFNGTAARTRVVSDEERGLLWPMIAEVHNQSADECARKLHSIFGRWLSEALGSSAYESRQFEVMASYLQGRDALRPERIDNELLFEFWHDQAFDSQRTESLGFKQYVSAVRALLKMRRALIVERSERHQVAIGSEPDELDLGRFEVKPIESLEWASPLLALGSPPCDAIKWLTKREQRYLRNYLPARAESPQESDTERSEDADQSDREWAAPPDGALMGLDRFELQFSETLLRADVFGVTQSLILSSLRRKEKGPDALRSALELVDSDSYVRARNQYLEIRSTLVDAAHAALYFLAVRGDHNAISLLEYLGGLAAVECLAGPATNAMNELTDEQNAELTAELIDRLRTAFRDPSRAPALAKSVIREAKSAASRIKREGFRPEQQLMPGVAVAYARSAPFVVSLLRELDRLEAVLGRLPLFDMMGRDRETFASVFEQLYLN